MRNSKFTVPSFHTRPILRLQKPICFEVPNNHPPAPLKVQKFHAVKPNQGRRTHELVHDPNCRLRGKFPQFSGDFECGNIGQVFQTGPKTYEIHLIPDPTKYYSALWYFFKVESIPPGDYQFIIVGFFRDSHLHNMGVQPVALSMRDAERGIGWKRCGDDMNFWCWKKTPPVEYALSFNFTVKQTDTMYFAYLYPYTYTDLRFWFSCHNNITLSVIGKSHNGIDVPAVFWDGDAQKFTSTKAVLSQPLKLGEKQKPLIVIAARHHPGETNASFAMEGFMEALIAKTDAAKRLREKFSVLMLPMMNVDGVICGYYRPTVMGYDMNRTWVSPDQKANPVEFAVVNLVDKLVRTRPFLFFLDYHGHTGQCNAFTYGVWNEDVEYNDYEGLFPRMMAQQTSLFDEEGCASLERDAYATTMRVAFHHRYQVPFAYTLEMTFGGITVGKKSYTQMTQDCYREVGQATVKSITTMLLDCVPLDAMIESYIPPIQKQTQRK